MKEYNAEQLLTLAQSKKDNIGIAFTYNEPLIAFETNIRVAHLFRKNTYKSIMVTNGYVNKEPLREYIKYIDAFNIDIKLFEEIKHIKHTGAKLDIILDNVIDIYKAKLHVELTFLLIPGVNDDEAAFFDFIRWINKYLSPEVPLHISQYFPRNKFTKPKTSIELLNTFAKIAKEELKYVYVGNVQTSNFSNTFCPDCNNEIINRIGYYTEALGATNDGLCRVCMKKIFIN
jgi:pyruvate formate lyase activating enzyme